MIKKYRFKKELNPSDEFVTAVNAEIERLAYFLPGEPEEKIRHAATQAICHCIRSAMLNCEIYEINYDHKPEDGSPPIAFQIKRVPSEFEA